MEEGDFEGYSRLYHPDAVLLPPDAGAVITGREQITDTYRDFFEHAHLEDFRVASVEQYEFDSGTAVHLRFEVTYGLGEERLCDRGLEVYWVDTTPLILWRQQIIDASTSAG